MRDDNNQARDTKKKKSNRGQRKYGYLYTKLIRTEWKHQGNKTQLNQV